MRSSFVALHDGTGAVGPQQGHQVLDLLRKLAAHISVGDLGLGVQPLKHLGGGGDIPIFLNGVGPATNGSWDTRRGAIGGIDQGIASDTGGLFGRLCKILRQ